MTKRIFTPGSEWLYIKIYTGIKTADIILEEIIKPLVKDFQQNQYILKWFFVRYNDPKPHLRIRFKLSDTENYQPVSQRINDILQGYIESGEISNILIDTYKREIERYGDNTIEEAETLFCHNSLFVLECLRYEDEEKIIICLYYIDLLLIQLGLSIPEKLDWIKNFNDGFKMEFNADKKLNSQLDIKYRDFKLKFAEFIDSDEFFEQRSYIISNINESKDVSKKICKYYLSDKFFLQSFFQSIFHMNINRLFNSDQRLFEMIIYDYLLRYYKSQKFFSSNI